MRYSQFICVCILASLVLASPVSTAGEEDQSEPLALVREWVYDASVELPEVPEPSSLCYCPPRDTLFIVDDGGPGRAPSVAELDLQANVLARLEIGQDLEGICFCSADGLLYIADEAVESVYVVNPEGLVYVAEFTYSADFAGELLMNPGGNGVEGIEFIPGIDGSYFLLLNQDDPHALVKITYDAAQSAIATGSPAPLAEHWLLPEVNLGELYYDQASSELWVVHSWMNVMEILDVPSMALKRWEVIPGAAQEAVAIDGQGRLWIGSDSGGIDRYIRPEAVVEEATE